MIGFSPVVTGQGGIFPGGQEAFFIHPFFAREFRTTHLTLCYQR
jgi:hypothetical protein